jgi:cell division protein FtsB
MLSEDTVELIEPAELNEAPRSGWQRPSWTGLVVLGMLVVISYNLYFVCHLRQIEYESKLAELQDLRQQMYLAEFSNHQLEARVAHLRTDAGVEEVAREKLGLVRKNEVAYVVIPQPSHVTVQDMTTVPKLAPPAPTEFQRFLHAVFR